MEVETSSSKTVEKTYLEEILQSPAIVQRITSSLNMKERLALKHINSSCRRCIDGIFHPESVLYLGDDVMFIRGRTKRKQTTFERIWRLHLTVQELRSHVDLGLGLGPDEYVEVDRAKQQLIVRDGSIVIKCYRHRSLFNDILERHSDKYESMRILAGLSSLRHNIHKLVVTIENGMDQKQFDTFFEVATLLQNYNGDRICTAVFIIKHRMQKLTIDSALRILTRNCCDSLENLHFSFLVRFLLSGYNDTSSALASIAELKKLKTLEINNGNNMNNGINEHVTADLLLIIRRSETLRDLRLRSSTLEILNAFIEKANRFVDEKFTIMCLVWAYPNGGAESDSLSLYNARLLISTHNTALNITIPIGIKMLL